MSGSVITEVMICIMYANCINYHIFHIMCDDSTTTTGFRSAMDILCLSPHSLATLPSPSRISRFILRGGGGAARSSQLALLAGARSLVLRMRGGLLRVHRKAFRTFNFGPENESESELSLSLLRL